MKTLSGILLSLRPRQWTKNFFVLSALIFSRNFFDSRMLLISIAAFVLFCMISGAVYLLNDIVDREKDRCHPEKSKRPIAAGIISLRTALFSLIFLVLTTLIGSWFLGLPFFLLILAYFVLQTAYSFYLKHIVIIDVFTITIGFSIRVFAGAMAINIVISSWLAICTFLLALFLALNKRRHELIILETDAGKHRKVLADYNTYFLDQMISVVTASTVVAYALYTLSEQTIQKFHTTHLVFTVPFVIYGIFRYLFLVHMKKRGGSPEMMLITDAPLLIDIMLWIGTAGIIIYR
jgi:4-hydroxybenzoate polyprenyltransferase